MNHNDYSEKILKELSDKYDKTFEIVKLSYEVDGENGNYYRAVCKEKDSENTFVAYYYLKGSEYLLSEDVGDELKVSKDKPRRKHLFFYDSGQKQDRKPAFFILNFYLCFQIIRYLQ